MPSPQLKKKVNLSVAAISVYTHILKIKTPSYRVTDDFTPLLQNFISEVVRRQLRRTVISVLMRQLCSCENSRYRKSCNNKKKRIISLMA